MPRHHFVISARRNPLWGGVFLLAAIGCSDERSNAGPTPAVPVPANEGNGQTAPLDLSYACGNRFRVYSTYPVPITVTYRVAESGEEGTVEVPAAPAIDPAGTEEVFQTRTKGTVQIFFKGKPIVTRANDGSVCTPPPPAGAAAMAGGQALASSWSAVFPMPIVAVHMMLLPNGRVLSIGRTGTPQVWNPGCGTAASCFTPVSAPANLFCAGHALLSDGRVLLAGGHIADRFGLPNITLFSYSNNTWTSETKMARGRWYPTATTMGSGEVVILGGSDESAIHVPIPEVRTATGAPARRLTGASDTLPWYPRSFLAPNGSLYMAGPTLRTSFLSIAGTGTWTSGPKHVDPEARNYGGAVMYEPGKILYAGGGLSPAVKTAEKIDLINDPVWRFTSPMQYARRHHNLTVLPTGEVLATGGVGTDGLDDDDFNDTDLPVRAAELWNPSTGTWVTLASNQITRGYHGTSLLLPDGRVLNAGSGEGAGAPSQKNFELFSPPYLFRGSRPTISSVTPTSVGYGATFTVATPQVAAVTRVTLIRLGAVTHAFDQNQRFQRLTIVSRNSTALTVRAPSVRNEAPPGYYMLFILTGPAGSDVPSVAKIIRIS
jgi:hypothetical protein